jgi:CheY-like chemotaxis protein
MSKRILVVEDQEDNRQILRDLLGSVGYEMTEAWDGEASVSAAKEQRPDLILMDIQLPLMDGYEATRRIKADPELKNSRFTFRVVADAVAKSRIWRHTARRTNSFWRYTRRTESSSAGRTFVFRFDQCSGPRTIAGSG